MGEPFATVINPIPTEVRSISSRHVNQEYRLFVSLPASYADEGKTYPVLYLLDGNGTFSLVRQIVEMLQILKQVPELILIGVGIQKR